MKKIKLKDNMIEYLVQQPEQGMGYQIVDVFLHNGSLLKNRRVVNSSYLLIEDNEELIIDEIREIKISHNS